ncbi:hypothetical protein [Miniphocaeibacter massiliensis]|uniref:hypothetical protein n=1 Tax=Miniphocaeibacter massiliensis TaxID=2041841 RepID=UPI000C1BD5B0|nr:hypothetical protein [Miniphocaeibacter massiliensis]
MNKIFELIENALNKPIQYGRNKDKLTPPYIVYLGDGVKKIEADNSVYSSKNNYRLELYFEKKDEKIENTIENILNENEYPWEKSEDIFISEENIFEIIYNI